MWHRPNILIWRICIFFLNFFFQIQVKDEIEKTKPVRELFVFDIIETINQKSSFWYELMIGGGDSAQ